MAQSTQRKLDYQKAYREKNKERLAEYGKSFRKANPDYQKNWISKHPVYNKAWREKHPNYWTNKYPERKRVKQSKSVAEVRALIESVKLYYGCCNPACCWRGEWKPCMLDFHHIDPKEKKENVSQVRNLPLAVQEINKCTILCANCHRLETWDNMDASGFRRCKMSDDGKFSEAEV